MFNFDYIPGSRGDVGNITGVDMVVQCKNLGASREFLAEVFHVL